jgi:hypothetical protein
MVKSGLLDPGSIPGEHLFVMLNLNMTVQVVLVQCMEFAIFHIYFRIIGVGRYGKGSVDEFSVETQHS